MGAKNKGAIRLPIKRERFVSSSKSNERSANEYHVGQPQMDASQEWQIEWMNQFAQSRNEANMKLQNAMLLNERQLDKIATLKGKNSRQHEVLVKFTELLNKKNMRINKYKTRCIEYKEKLKPKQSHLVDKCTFTEPNELIVPISTQVPSQCVHCLNSADLSTNMKPVQPTESIEPMSIEMPSHDVPSMNDLDLQETADLVQPIESIELMSSEMPKHDVPSINGMDPQETVEQVEPKKSINSNAKHKCTDCPKTFSKLDGLLVHRAEFCVNPAIKDRECKFCGKKYTRRALRVHINQYVTNKHKPKGKHSNVSMAEHQVYLAQIKAEIS